MLITIQEKVDLRNKITSCNRDFCVYSFTGSVHYFHSFCWNKNSYLRFVSYFSTSFCKQENAFIYKKNLNPLLSLFPCIKFDHTTKIQNIRVYLYYLVLKHAFIVSLENASSSLANASLPHLFVRRSRFTSASSRGESTKRFRVSPRVYIHISIEHLPASSFPRLVTRISRR